MKIYYNYFYKITNNLNNKYYYGVHRTNNLDDNYMGSGIYILRAIKKYGIQNFSKEILKYFDTIEEAYKYEASIVTDKLVNDRNCYNVKLGGNGWMSNGCIYAINEDNQIILISQNNPLYLNGIYKSLASMNKIKAINKNGNILSLDKNDERLLSGEYVNIMKTKVMVKDKNNNYFFVDKDDLRYLSNEVVPSWLGRHHKDETKQKISQTHKNNNFLVGSSNTNYGKCWITNGIETKTILKNLLDIYLLNGWHKGRTYSLQAKENINKANLNKAWIHNLEGKTKQIYKKDLDIYLLQGWLKGRGKLIK